MGHNVGRVDQFVRAIVGLAIFAFVFNDGAMNAMWPALLPIAVILIGTAFFSFCPLYTVLGWNTGKRRLS